MKKQIKFLNSIKNYNMKKLLFILSVVSITMAVNAQQTEDEIYIGKGKTFGKYTGRSVTTTETGKTTNKTVTNPTILTGIVVSGGEISPVQDSLKNKPGSLYSFNLKKDDGTVVAVGTRDYEFTVPKELIGKNVSIEGLTSATLLNERKRRSVQKDVEFAAIGILVTD